MRAILWKPAKKSGHTSSSEISGNVRANTCARQRPSFRWAGSSGSGFSPGNASEAET